MVAANPSHLSRTPAERSPARPPRRRHHRGSRHGHLGGACGGRWLRLAAGPVVLTLLLGLFLPVAAAAAQDDEDADAGEAPAGEYTVAITEDDVPSDLVNGPDLIGRWQVFLQPDGAYSLRRADIGEVATGTYTVENETLTFTDETGLLSCVNAVPTGGAGVPTASGSYGWELNDDGLTLSTIEDGCAGRQLVLGTRPLDFFVACDTEPVAIAPPTGDEGDEEASDDTTATDEDEATEDDESAADEGAADEGAQDEGDDSIDNPFGGDDATDEGEQDQDVEVDEDSAAEGIDAVLGQLTACWTTQDPARIIPLFGTEYIDGLTEQTGSLYDVAGVFGQIMAIPISWERAGEVELNGTGATALVSQTIGAEESFVRFQFAFEDGVWKLNSFG